MSKHLQFLLVGMLLVNQLAAYALLGLVLHHYRVI